MNSKLNSALVALVCGVSLLGTQAALAEGCLKGAAVGGVAGHVAGHHGVIGAAAGCAVGRHRANKARSEKVNAEKAPATKTAPVHAM